MCLFAAPVAGAAIGSAQIAVSSAAMAAAFNAGAISLATTAYTQYAQNQQQKAVFSQQKSAGRINRAAAQEDANASYQQLAARELQEREATEATISDVEGQAQRNAALAATSAGEAGVSGNTAAAIANDIRRQGITETGRAKRSLTFTEGQIDAERKAVHAQTKGRFANTQLGPRPSIDYFGAALNVGANAFSAYSVVKYT